MTLSHRYFRPSGMPEAWAFGVNQRAPCLWLFAQGIKRMVSKNQEDRRLFPAVGYSLLLLGRPDTCCLRLLWSLRINNCQSFPCITCTCYLQWRRHSEGESNILHHSWDRKRRLPMVKGERWALYSGSSWNSFWHWTPVSGGNLAPYYATPCYSHLLPGWGCSPLVESFREEWGWGLPHDSLPWKTVRIGFSLVNRGRNVITLVLVGICGVCLGCVEIVLGRVIVRRSRVPFEECARLLLLPLSGIDI